jgi:hypothetical protein
MIAMVSTAPPVVMLTFANDHIDEQRYLRKLPHELRGIRDTLRPLVDGEQAEVLELANATAEDIIKAFLAPRCLGRVAIFHFGGHANDSTLLLEDGRGGRASAPADGIAAYLARQEQLVLVFLNGCATAAQVQLLRQRGVKAVVATLRPIKDEVASELARLFYQHLCVLPLAEAFESATAAARLLPQQVLEHPRDAYRDDYRELVHDLPEEEDELEWPWVLDCDPAYRSWRLVRPPVRPEPRPPSTRPWWALGGLALLAGMAVVLTNFVGPRDGKQPGPVAGPIMTTHVEPESATGGAVVGGSTSGFVDDGGDEEVEPSGEIPTEPRTDGGDSKPRPKKHCKIDADFQDAWTPRCAEGKRVATEALAGRSLHDYRSKHPKLRTCDTITLYSCR